MENLALEFINTGWYMTHAPNKNVLADPVWLANFLHYWHLPLLNPLSRFEMDRLIKLRDFLSTLVDTFASDSGIQTEQLIILNQYLTLTPLQYTLVDQEGHYQTHLQPIQADLDSLLFHIARSFTELLVDVKAERIKYCQNPECRWAYIDESKNSTRKWCGNTCASLIKVRRHRKNQRL